MTSVNHLPALNSYTLFSRMHAAIVSPIFSFRASALKLENGFIAQTVSMLVVLNQNFRQVIKLHTSI